MTESRKTEFKCEFCHSIFTRSYNLKRHIERKHDAQNVTPVAQNVTLLGENKNLQENQCSHCNKILANTYSLKRHNIKCTGVKDPYICNFCNKSFNTRNGKSKHTKICKLKNNIPDRKIYPELISQIAEDMQEVVNDKFENLKSKEKLFDLLDYFIFKQVPEDNKETERRYKQIYNLVVEEQKLYAIGASNNY